MRVAALSDLHIGATEEVDCFRHQPEQFLEFLGELERDHDRIVLLGDVFQCEHGWRMGHKVAEREFWRIKERVPWLWRRIDSDKYIYIHGNHDHIAAKAIGAKTCWRVSADGFTAFFIHGHQYDPMLRYLYPLARTGTWFSGRLRSVGLGAASDWLEHKDITVKAERFGGAGGPYASAARALFAKQCADAVIMGHTHTPDRLEFPEGIYANTGSCSVGQRMYISIDTARRSVELFRPSAWQNP